MREAAVKQSYKTPINTTFNTSSLILKSQNIKEFYLERKSDDEHYGFCLRGGKNIPLGIYVSNILKNSLADLVGLKANDHVLSINNLDTCDLTIEEASNYCSRNNVILLRVKRKTTSNSNNAKPKTGRFELKSEYSLHRVKIFRQNLTCSFGFTINSVFESNSLKNICISEIKPNTPASNSNLRTGDEILELNEKKIEYIDDFYDILRIIKSVWALNVLVKRRAAKIISENDLKEDLRSNLTHQNVEHINLTLLPSTKSASKRKKKSSYDKKSINNYLSQLPDKYDQESSQTNIKKTNENIYDNINILNFMNQPFLNKTKKNKFSTKSSKSTKTRTKNKDSYMTRQKSFSLQNLLLALEETTDYNNIYYISDPSDNETNFYERSMKSNLKYDNNNKTDEVIYSKVFKTSKISSTNMHAHHSDRKLNEKASESTTYFKKEFRKLLEKDKNFHRDLNEPLNNTKGSKNKKVS
jgi:hypothetical protein